MTYRGEFYTIEKKTIASEVIQKSRFIALAIPVSTEQDITYNLQEIRKEYPSAHHYCYAYIIGHTSQQVRYSDDGEPSGTAGLQIYNQLRSFRLVNVLVVVVRYFGGIHLGIKGLRKAYSEVVHNVLMQCDKIIYRDIAQISVFCSYETLHIVFTVLKRYHASINQQEISTTCSIQCSVAKDDVIKIQHELREYATIINKPE